MSTDDKVGGHRGGKPASEMGPPAKLPSGSVTSPTDTAYGPCEHHSARTPCHCNPMTVDALRTRLARAFEVAALRDPSAELAAFEAAVRHEHGERIAAELDAYWCGGLCAKRARDLSPAPGVEVMNAKERREEHRCEWGNFGWACSCGVGREWPLAPVERARRAAQAHQRAQTRRRLVTARDLSPPP